VQFLCTAAVEAYPDPTLDRIARLVEDIQQGWPEPACPEHQLHLQPLVEARSLKVSTEALRAKLTVNGEFDPALFENFQAELATMQLLLGTSKHNVERLDKILFATARVLLLAAIEGGKSLQTAIGEHALAISMASAKVQIDVLRDLQFGMPGGANWLEGLDENKRKLWEEFFDYAGKTIMKEKLVAGMKKNLEIAKKVPAPVIWNQWSGTWLVVGWSGQFGM
jgi:hypothetical protein